MARDVMLATVDHRFGNVINAPMAIELWTVNVLACVAVR
jgi:hypothetical protein